MVETSALKRPAWGGLLANVFITMAVAAVTFGVLAKFGLNRRETEVWPAFAPPGHTIGLIWIGLFAVMGAARWFAPSAGDARAVGGLIILCLAYPFYTHIIGGHAIQFAGNAVTFAYSVWLIARLRRRSRAAAGLVAVVAAWVVFATVLVVALVKLNGWLT